MCGYECECDSVELHKKYERQSLQEFLRDPGPPPAWMDAASVRRAKIQMDKERKKLGIR